VWATGPGIRVILLLDLPVKTPQSHLFLQSDCDHPSVQAASLTRIIMEVLCSFPCFWPSAVTLEKCKSDYIPPVQKPSSGFPCHLVIRAKVLYVKLASPLSLINTFPTASGPLHWPFFFIDYLPSEILLDCSLLCPCLHENALARAVFLGPALTLSVAGLHSPDRFLFSHLTCHMYQNVWLCEQRLLQVVTKRVWRS
jgi:hypothetical protein